MKSIISSSLATLFGLLISLPTLAQPTASLTLSINNSPIQIQGNLPQNPDDHPPGPPHPPRPPRPPDNENHYYYYDFGQVPVNMSRMAAFTLTSTGSGNLYLDRINLWGGGFYGRANCPHVMPPGSRCDVYVEFRPWYEGSFNGRLAFVTSAGNFIVDLYGWGVRW